MKLHRVNVPNHELKEREGKYCAICTPSGCICPSNWPDKSDWEEKREETEEEEEVQPVESDWDADLEEAPDYHATFPIPMRQHGQPPKVLMLEPRKCPAGWPAGVRSDLPSKLDHLKNRNAQPEEECEYLEPVQRHVSTEPTPMEESEVEPEIHVTTVPTEQPDTDVEGAYEPVGSMEELE